MLESELRFDFVPFQGLLNATPERLFKVVFVGDSGVGKSSFIHQFCKQEFRATFAATIGRCVGFTNILFYFRRLHRPKTGFTGMDNINVQFTACMFSFIVLISLNSLSLCDSFKLCGRLECLF